MIAAWLPSWSVAIAVFLVGQARRLYSREVLALGLSALLALAVDGIDHSALTQAGYASATIGDVDGESPEVNPLRSDAAALAIPPAWRPSVVSPAAAPDHRLCALSQDRDRAPPIPA